jgi:uncharacterized protein with PIN domain
MTNQPTDRLRDAWARWGARKARRKAREAAARCPQCGGALADGRCTVCGYTVPKKDAA